MSDIRNRLKELSAQYAQLDPKPPLPTWVSAVDRDSGQLLHKSSGGGLGDPVALAICLTVWEGLLASARLPGVYEETAGKLPSSRVVTCVYCGHEYPSGTPTSQDQLLTEHIRKCEKHPMSTVTKQRDMAVDTLEKLAKLLQGKSNDNRIHPDARDVLYLMASDIEKILTWEYMPFEPLRHCIMTDDDGHWFVVPVEQQEAFSRWSNDIALYWEGDAEGPEPQRPPGVQEIGGTPSLVTFICPSIHK